VYQPDTEEWTYTGRLRRRTFSHSSILLNDGTVLLIGGFGAGAGPYSVEMYDPEVDTWSKMDTGMNDGRSLHTATVLPDGRVLVVGGSNEDGNMDTTEVYDPSTGLWTPAGIMAARRAVHTATLLRDGRVLIVGGGVDVVEVFHPASGTWASSDQ
jgi:hypothetical protein